MGTLSIVATPIGNREDITLRALKILFSVDIVACEDTRRAGLLLKYYRGELLDSHPEPSEGSGSNEILRSLSLPQNDQQRFISFYDEIEERRTPEIIALLQSGKNVALVSDAGTPLISDPGFKLVRECHRQHIPVSPIPGPSSVIAALSACGLPTDRFLFFGYLPKKMRKREKLLQKIKELKDSEFFKTVVFLETPHHINKTLEELHEIVPESSVCIANELTKMFEKISIETLPLTIENPKGEYVVIIA